MESEIPDEETVATGELSYPNHPNPNPNPNPTLIDLQVGHTDIIRPLQI